MRLGQSAQGFGRFLQPIVTVGDLNVGIKRIRFVLIPAGAAAVGGNGGFVPTQHEIAVGDFEKAIAQPDLSLQIELPGVLLSDVRLEALDGRIKVAGHRRPHAGVEPRHFVRMERIYGSFSREFAVPSSIDPTLIKATLRAGVLRVVAPRAEKGQPIPVEKRKAR